MATHLIVHGHGAGDPGGTANGTNERDFTRKTLHPYLKKWADISKHKFVFYDTSGSKDLYQDTAKGWGLHSITSKQYASVTEIHLDASTNTSATGGHVIISSKFNPDKNDLSIAGIIKKIVGWWGSVAKTQGVNKRNNLLNCNVAATRGICYRLLELGFITNKSDMTKINKNLDGMAKGIIEGITGETLKAPAATTGKPDPAKYWDKPGWYEFIKPDTLYLSTSFSEATRSGVRLGAGSRFYADEVTTNPSKTATRGVVMAVGKSGKRYFSLNKSIVKKV